MSPDTSAGHSLLERSLRSLRAWFAVCMSLVILALAGALGVSAASYTISMQGGAHRLSAIRNPIPVRGGVEWKTVGRSVLGRPIRMARFGSGSRRMLVIGGIHGSEFGADVAEAFAFWMQKHPESVPLDSEVDVVACANPDGRAANQKANADGVNLNGNFPTSNWKAQKYKTSTAGPAAGSEPETQVLVRLLESGYARVVSLHSQGGIVDYDGPGGLAVAQSVASASGLPVKKLGPASVYTGSLGTYVPERFGIPIITIELTSRAMTPSVLAGLLAAVK